MKRVRRPQGSKAIPINYYCLFACIQPINVSAPPSSSSARINGFMAYIQLTTPSEPASAVSTAMRILRIFPQLVVFAFEFIMV